MTEPPMIGPPPGPASEPTYGLYPQPPRPRRRRRFLSFLVVAAVAASAGAGTVIGLSGSPGSGVASSGGSSPRPGTSSPGSSPAGTSSGARGATGGTASPGARAIPVPPAVTPQAASGPLDAQAVTDKVQPGIVNIDAPAPYSQQLSEGTGMVLTASGLVLTNNHVISGATSPTATLAASGKTYKATILG